ncbi:IGR protein motif-domain-containing protein [Xylaria sp. CBS 124048]|nr:IGR protein motif-domain-containing protein [Xylaria sp. CBS 124048]
MASIKSLLRPQHLRGVFSVCPPPSHTLPQTIFLQSSIRHSDSTRAASTKAPRPPLVPPPIPLVPDVETFLTIIGRGLKQHAAKIPDWETLFTLTSEQLRELGVEPPRSRRYLIRWRERFRLGQYGVGGDLKYVENGVAELRVLEAAPTPNGTQAPRKVVVNVAPGRDVEQCTADELSRVLGYHVQGARTIVGPYALQMKESEGVRITMTEGMWEDRRGHKVDGGERRQAQVRYKKRIAERREARERDGQ